MNVKTEMWQLALYSTAALALGLIEKRPKRLQDDAVFRWNLKNCDLELWHERLQLKRKRRRSNQQTQLNNNMMNGLNREQNKLKRRDRKCKCEHLTWHCTRCYSFVVCFCFPTLSVCADTARNPEFMEMHSGTSDPPLCLMIGYTDGMQIWSVSVSHTANGLVKVQPLPFCPWSLCWSVQW